MFNKVNRLAVAILCSFQMFSCSELFALEMSALSLNQKEIGFFLKKTEKQAEDLLDWKRYDYTQTGGFSIKFPDNPDHTGQIIEIPQSELTIRYDTYVTEGKKDSSVYVVSVWEYPEKIDMSRPELNLQEGFAGMLQALPDSQILFMQASQVQGYKSLEFWISYDDVYFRGVLISVNHTLYQVFVVYKNKDSHAIDQEYNTFIKSFEITKVREVKNTSLKKKVNC